MDMIWCQEEVKQMLAEQGSDGMGCAPCHIIPSGLPWSLPSEHCAQDRAQLSAELTALKRTQRAQTESMMMLVHELRSPVATSKSMVATLRYLNQENEQFGGVLARIENRMDQLLDLVNHILDLSQARAGQPLGEAVILDLAARTSPICELYQEEAVGKGLAMTVELPESPVWVRMPERAYHLILSNLVSNALKYTPSGYVGITLRQDGSWVVLEVQDSGIGIPEGEIPLLFTEFFRASNACHGKFPGTGLGLAGVRALVERWGGRLEVESQENRGSRFAVRLPVPIHR
jgi:signal transduction histidine kinase